MTKIRRNPCSDLEVDITGSNFRSWPQEKNLESLDNWRKAQSWNQASEEGTLTSCCLRSWEEGPCKVGT